MRNLCKLGSCVLSLFICTAASASTSSLPRDDGDTFKIMGGLQDTYDSNYLRRPEKVPEQITQPSLGVSFNETWSNQHLSARWQGTRFIFDKSDDESTNLQTGAIDWQSLWPMGFKSSLSFKRSGYLVDKLEFSGVDVSTQDLMQARIGYGFSDGWSFNLGGRGFKQLYDNDTRNNMQYDEADAFAEIGYTTASGSSAMIRGRNGKRTYSREALLLADINFDYRQAEIETTWIMSAKTNIALLFAGYNRQGAANDDSGTVASFEANWLPTEKLEFKSTYSLQHPAVGESIEGISKIQTALLSAQWQLTTKLSFNTRLSHSRSRYENVDPLLERSEDLIIYSPLGLTYLPTNNWQIKVDTGWRKNASSLVYREYIAGQVSAGVFFVY